jgi:photosystem II cytochrome c550
MKKILDHHIPREVRRALIGLQLSAVGKIMITAIAITFLTCQLFLFNTSVVVAAETPVKIDENRMVQLNANEKTLLTKGEIGKGKKLFNTACANCHVGGATLTNPNVGLDIGTLAQATPQRNTIEGLVDFMKNPTTFDGVEEINELHPSLKSTDIFPIMRGLTDPELKAIAAYILYSANLKGVSWGGGKIYY